MDERSRRAEELFHSAAGLRSEQRAAWLEARCAGDAELRDEVSELLLSLDACDPRFLERAPLPPSAPAIPTTMGRYRLVRMIGEGGMGCVYEAEQENPRRSVALKVLRSGSSSAGLLRRFRREAELLGKLRHPGIAQVYDAGAFVPSEGGPERPYFVMDLIDGVPLETFASRQGLGTRARLELFARLCDAVQHAHERGVVHRDLKPANILVDEHGQPKVLDFGIAHLTGAEALATTLSTEAGELLGTLPYMSPEQVAGRSTEIDPRSDVYALGVLLYEFLAGCLPYDLRGKSLPDAGRVIQEEEPIRLGARNAAYRGDLETIVSRALEKEKARRYPAVSELAGDLRRHIQDEPIRARPASALYRLHKLARRNKGLAGGICATFLVLCVALVAITSQALRLRREKLRAEEISGLLETVLSAADPYPSVEGPSRSTSFGMNARLVDVLDELLRELDRRPLHDPVAEAIVRQRMALSYFGVARYEDGARNASLALALLEDLGDEPEALRLKCKMALSCNLTYMLDGDRSRDLALEAIAGCERLHGEHHEETLRALHCLWLSGTYAGRGRESIAAVDRMEEIASTSPRPLDYARYAIKLQRAATLLWGLGRPAESEALAREALQECISSTSGKSHWEAYAHAVLGSAAASRGDFVSAEREYRTCVEDWKAVAGETAALEFEQQLGCSISFQDGRLEEGLASMRETVERARLGHGRYAAIPSRLVQRLAVRLRQASRLQEARSCYEEYFEMVERGRHPPFEEHAHARYNLATLLLELGLPLEAEAELREAVRIAHGFSEERWQRQQFDDRIYVATLALLLEQGGRATEAAPLREELSRRAGRSRDPDTANHLAWQLVELGMPREAEAIAREALAELRAASEPTDVDLTVGLLDTVATALCTSGRHEEAQSTWREGEDLCNATTSSVEDFDEISLRYGHCLVELGHFAAAETVLVRALESLRADGSDEELLAQASQEVDGLYSAWGRPR